MRSTFLLACLIVIGCATGNNSDGFGGEGAGGSSAGGEPAGGNAPAGGASNGGAPETGGAPSGGESAGGEDPAGGRGEGGSGPTNPGVLVFSEYVEGSSNNKAIEIANIGDEPIALDDCVINRYQNGSTTPLAALLAINPNTLAPGATYVVCNSQFAQLAFCDQTTANLAHNGNDVVELSCGGQVEDIIGRIGEDAVWGTTPTITADATLRRKCTVTAGDTNGSDAFDPAVEWTGFAVDTFSDLGLYTCP